MKVVKWLDEHMEEFLLVILLVVIACVSLLQVIIRKIPWIPSLTRRRSSAVSVGFGVCFFLFHIQSEWEICFV